MKIWSKLRKAARTRSGLVMLPVLVALVFLVAPPLSGANPALCSSPDKILTEGDDIWNGDSSDEVIWGLGGNDVINGNGGEGPLCGGARDGPSGRGGGGKNHSL